MKIPKSEKTKVTINRNKVNKVFVLTYNENKKNFVLYNKVGENNYKKLSTSTNPLKLQEDVFSGKWDNIN